MYTPMSEREYLGAGTFQILPFLLNSKWNQFLNASSVVNLPLICSLNKFLELKILGDTFRYTGLLLARAEGFGLRPGFFCP